MYTQKDLFLFGDLSSKSPEIDFLLHIELFRFHIGLRARKNPIYRCFWTWQILLLFKNKTTKKTTKRTFFTFNIFIYLNKLI